MSESEPTVRERCEAIIEDALNVKAGHGYGVGATSAEVFDAILAELREPGFDAIEVAADHGGRHLVMDLPSPGEMARCEKKAEKELAAYRKSRHSIFGWALSLLAAVVTLVAIAGLVVFLVLMWV